ncbi:hypothetical protein BKA65DRAFT_285130 [Rhexocercosporidium sp. MPI-PUGE-AT-0058]|nr:hypothetical protein BKA65DRAFT_285130 [Rhexocercosporidium sp. MPI-PUGE-AT-0058]
MSRSRRKSRTQSDKGGEYFIGMFQIRFRVVRLLKLGSFTFAHFPFCADFCMFCCDFLFQRARCYQNKPSPPRNFLESGDNKSFQSRNTQQTTARMCKLYQIEYTCRHLAKAETAYCGVNQPSSCSRGVEILTQHAPHKCPPCRNYDRDRWRRGWPPLPLPQPARACIPRMRTITAEPDSDDDDFAVEFEEGTFLGKVEHCEDTGGVGLGLGGGLGFGAGVGEGVVMIGGLNGEDTGSSEGFGLGIDGAGTGTEAGDTSTTTTPTMTSSRAATNPERGLVSKKHAESFTAGDGEGVGSELRSRFGGYGGKKLRGRRSSTAEAVGGVPMERTVSKRGSLSLRSPSGSNYRGADMERGGGGMGLGLGLGLGFGGVTMERKGEGSTVQGSAKGPPSTRRRSHNILKLPSASTSEVEGTSDDTLESATAQFLGF